MGEKNDATDCASWPRLESRLNPLSVGHVLPITLLILNFLESDESCLYLQVSPKWSLSPRLTFSVPKIDLLTPLLLAGPALAMGPSPPRGVPDRSNLQFTQLASR